MSVANAIAVDLAAGRRRAPLVGWAYPSPVQGESGLAAITPEPIVIRRDLKILKFPVTLRWEQEEMQTGARVCYRLLRGL